MSSKPALVDYGNSVRGDPQNLGAALPSISVTVAAPFHLPARPLRDVPSVWDAAPKETYSVESDTTLWSLLTRAGKSLNVGEAGTWWIEDPVDVYAVIPFQLYSGMGSILEWDASSLALVDDEGRAFWTAPDFRLVTIDALRTAQSAGILEGDPSRIYIVQSPGGAAGLEVDWRSIIDALAIIYGVGRDVADAMDVAKLVQRVTQLGDRALRLLRKKAAAWTARGARPRDIARVVQSARMTPATIAGLLGCTIDESELLIQILGESPTEDQAVLLVRSFVLAAGKAYVGHHLDERGLSEIVRQHIESLAANGLAAEFEASQLPAAVATTSDQTPPDAEVEPGQAYPGPSTSLFGILEFAYGAVPVLTLAAASGLVAAQYSRGAMWVTIVAVLIVATVVALVARRAFTRDDLI